MNKWILILSLLLGSQIAIAHQADISSTMLIEQAYNKWVLQIRASLTAFQYEVKSQDSDTTYNSPEEFQELVLQHLQKNLLIYFNEQDTAVLKNGHVKLGHETSVFFEVVGVPKTIESIFLKNASFKDIHRNQSALILLKKGLPAEQFVLNNENQHTAMLAANQGKFVLLNQGMGKSIRLLLYFFGGLILLAVGIAAYFWLRSKNTLQFT